MEQVLSVQAFNDLKHMLSDDNIVTAMFKMEKDKAKHIQVNPNGTIILGKTSWSWWNRLFNDEVILSTNDVCNRLINIITGTGGTRNVDAFRDLHSDFAEALMQENYSYIISRIFIGYRFYYLKDIEPDKQSKTDGNVYRTVTGAIAIDGMGKMVFVPLKNNK